MNTLAKKDDKRYQYKIYKICSDECELFYIGSTRDITSRKSKHKSVCNKPNNKEYNTKKYQTIRANGGWDNFRMVVIEVMENTTKLEAEMREEVVRVELNAKMNSQRASCGGMTIQQYNRQYRIDNIEYCNEYNKQYRIDNKKQISAKATQKYDCKCGGKYTYSHKAEHIKSNKHQAYLLSLAI
tara:strand:+ start:36 stop:587 length:552 start_codon:yes stop_codon:yes gene_type:complete